MDAGGDDGILNNARMSAVDSRVRSAAGSPSWVAEKNAESGFEDQLESCQGKYHGKEYKLQTKEDWAW